ncbi:nucleotidyl transferase AbiEii/AbiGii toxin family protein [Flavobacterium aquicola]|uniref:Nucleotidyltransferase AbiEii toxin of type IV toxin-antitoxin system n=1 Tax=Flavobacterium aquicola TaxID=1682742 RepID=A0A3E0EJY5_9FLAO|nr:nucleotidyl transferase AbiEii/AbiGii toxin family protein [Flavobacterium aquicola]REG98455.1 nucleotidyltransferase AbiEii toxin of type IV toxin-antitoxin system [Flavobacterium aquicola]
MEDLYWDTVSPLLKEILIDLMQEELFSPFRLVGGTALSLQIGHRMSVDIDLFTDADYGSIDFEKIKIFLKNKYDFYSTSPVEIIAFGTYFKIGYSKANCIKLDLYYTDPYIDTIQEVSTIRMASIQEIIAMKLDVILRGGRKKDFWDLHYFLDKISIDEMISFFEKRYPYTDDSTRIKEMLVNFDDANLDFDPNCLLDKNWEMIKIDFAEKLHLL